VGEHVGQCMGELAGERVNEGIRMSMPNVLTSQRKHLCHKLP
jgi:hypothetical protein